MEIRDGPQRFGGFFSPVDIHIEDVNMRATALYESSGDGEAYPAGYRTVRGTPRRQDKGTVPPPVMRATLVIFNTLDRALVAIVTRSDNDEGCLHCGIYSMVHGTQSTHFNRKSICYWSTPKGS